MANDQTPSDTTLHYEEIILSRGLSVPFVPDIVTPNIEKPLRSGRYEAGELGYLEDLIKPDDRVLDLGAGLGLVAATASKLTPDGAILSIEAHPGLEPMIRAVWKLNGVKNAELKQGLVAASSGAPAPFYTRSDFWASSAESQSRPYAAMHMVPQLGIDDLIETFRPTIICCDIEGAEDGLFDTADLSGVRAMVLETHPKVYGVDQRSAILSILGAAGLTARPQPKPSTVYVLERSQAPAEIDVPWPPKDPRVLVVTCMKDEGPFILEWIAWHKAIGVTDFVVFSNDCTDGTDTLLDHLDARGDVTHLPNPALVARKKYFQPKALTYVQSMPVFRAADFVLPMDVDEFVNIRTGDGTLDALFQAVSPFDVLSVCELNHGANDHETFQPGWVTDLFPRHDTPNPGRWRARVGVKSLTRLSPRIEKVRNHRPDLGVPPAAAVWLDGSGNRMDDLAKDEEQNGVDSRGKRDIVSLQHFALRSVDSFLVKAWRGDAIVEGKQVKNVYFKRRNRNTHRDMDLSTGQTLARKAYADFEADPTLMDLHNACVRAHQDRIAALNSDPTYIERRRDLLDIAAAQRTPPPANDTGGDGQS